jgi:hypothetical protein
VATHPTRFGFFAILPMPDADGSATEAAYALDELGADGVVLLSSHHDGSYLGDPRFDAVLAELDRRSAVAFVHPVAPAFFDRIDVSIPAFAIEFTFDTTRAAFNLAHTGALERYPDIRFVQSFVTGSPGPRRADRGGTPSDPSRPGDRLVTPAADAVISAIPVPRRIHLLRAVPDFDEESRRTRDVEAERSLVVVEAESVGELKPTGPRTVERQAHIVPIVGLHLEVVEGLAEV